MSASNKCPNCGEEGAHYVPPCFGDAGFYICDKELYPGTPQTYTPWTPVLVPCNHYWLEVRTKNGEVTAVCKHRGCQKKEIFSLQQWSELAAAGRCLNKPVRV